MENFQENENGMERNYSHTFGKAPRNFEGNLDQFNFRVNGRANPQEFSEDMQNNSKILSGRNIIQTDMSQQFHPDHIQMVGKLKLFV